MKYKDVDWSRFDDRPSEEMFNEWAKARKEKHRSAPNQAAINLMAGHINKLYQSGYSVDKCFLIAASEGWRSIKFAWVVGWYAKDMDGYQDQGETRDMSLQKELTDRNWAH